MSYSVEFTDASLVDLEKLTPKTGKRILKKIRWLAENFESLPSQTLKGELNGSFKQRIGDYRVIYSFDNETKVIEILRVGHRRDIYE